jgi:hypothetical protein
LGINHGVVLLAHPLMFHFEHRAIVCPPPPPPPPPAKSQHWPHHGLHWVPFGTLDRTNGCEANNMATETLPRGIQATETPCDTVTRV